MATMAHCFTNQFLLLCPSVGVRPCSGAPWPWAVCVLLSGAWPWGLLPGVGRSAAVPLPSSGGRAGF